MQAHEQAGQQKKGRQHRVGQHAGVQGSKRARCGGHFTARTRRHPTCSRNRRQSAKLWGIRQRDVTKNTRLSHTLGHAGGKYLHRSSTANTQPHHAWLRTLLAATRIIMPMPCNTGRAHPGVGTCGHMHTQRARRSPRWTTRERKGVRGEEQWLRGGGVCGTGMGMQPDAHPPSTTPIPGCGPASWWQRCGGRAPTKRSAGNMHPLPPSAAPGRSSPPPSHPFTHTGGGVDSPPRCAVPPAPWCRVAAA
jgi:hypothetical protein